MNDPNKIRQFVRPQILLGTYTKMIFVNICREFAGYEPDTLTRDSKRPKRFDIYDLDTEMQLPEDSRLAYRILCEEFKKAQQALKVRQCPAGKVFQDYPCKCFLLTARYALQFEFGAYCKLSVYLFDTLYEQKRIVQTPTDLFGSNLEMDVHYRCTSFIPMSEEYFLGVRRTFRKSAVILYHLDLAKMECKVLDLIPFENATLFTCLVDSDNPRKFAINYGGNGGEAQIAWLQKCVIVDGKFKIEKKVLAFEEVADPSCFKLAGDTIYGKKTEYRNKDPFFVFNKFTIGENAIKKEKICEIKIGSEINMSSIFTVDYDRQSYFWLGTTFYMMTISIYECRLFRFDLDTKQITPLGLYLFETVHSMLVDNGVLIIYVSANGSNQHIYKRIPLIQPDSLLNLAMEATHQQSRFMDKSKFNALVSKFPPNLRPFGGAKLLRKGSQSKRELSLEPECSTSKAQRF